jgi:hypothetical protein
VYGVPDDSRKQQTYFVCATDIGQFVRSVVPFGWVMWQNPRVNVVLPRPPQVPPPIDLGQPNVPRDPDIVAALTRIEVVVIKRLDLLESRIVMLETKPPATPSGEGLPGQRGAIGLTGPKGDPGESVAGPPGVAGAQGPRGVGTIGPKGDPGQPGSDPSDEQVLRVVQIWLGKNLASIKGRPGETGEPGPPGEVDVIFKWSDGRVIQTLRNLRNKAEVEVPLDKIIQEPK